MTEQLHRLIDSGAPQPVINERVAAVLEADKKDLESLTKVVTDITSDHEKRIRFMERTVNYVLGAIGLSSAILYLISVLKS
jgi:hypothetical protein